MLWRLDQNQNYMVHLRCYVLNFFKLSGCRSFTSVVCSSKILHFCVPCCSKGQGVGNKDYKCFVNTQNTLYSLPQHVLNVAGNVTLMIVLIRLSSAQRSASCCISHAAIPAPRCAMRSVAYACGGFQMCHCPVGM